MADTTPNLSLPLLMPSQAQKHLTHNDALLRLDALAQISVLDRRRATPPPSPADGARYIVPPDAAGAWAGKTGHLAIGWNGGWDLVAPATGWLAFVTNENLLLAYSGGEWRPAVATLQNASLLGLNTVADAGNPFAAKLNKALWTARTLAEGGDGDLRCTLNKEASGDVLSMLFQTGFSGRAEFGLVGDDDVSLKVSADGTSWKTALAVSRASGRAAMPKGLDVGGGLVLAPRAGG